MSTMPRCPISCGDFDGEGSRLATHESAIPIDRQYAIDPTKDGKSGLWLDCHPLTDWLDWLDCDNRLYGQSLCQTDATDVLAVSYSCPTKKYLAR